MIVFLFLLNFSLSVKSHFGLFVCFVFYVFVTYLVQTLPTLSVASHLSQMLKLLRYFIHLIFFFFLFLKIFIYLLGCARSHSTWDLQSSLQHAKFLVVACKLCLQHVGSSSLTRDRTCTLWIGSMEFSPLGHQGSKSPFGKLLMSADNISQKNFIWSPPWRV